MIKGSAIGIHRIITPASKSFTIFLRERCKLEKQLVSHKTKRIRREKSKHTYYSKPQEKENKTQLHTQLPNPPKICQGISCQLPHKCWNTLREFNPSTINSQNRICGRCIAHMTFIRYCIQVLHRISINTNLH